MKRTLLACLLVICLLLCSCTPAISGDHDPTLSGTAPTSASTQPTEPLPTEPITTPPAGTPFSDAALADLQTLFQWPGYYAIASHSTFSTPAELPLMKLLREGPDVETRFAMTEEEKAHLSAVSEAFGFLDTHRIRRDAAAQALEQYYGLTLEEIADPGRMAYWEKTDYYYYYVSDTVACQLTVTQAVACEDGTVWVCYRDQMGMGRIGAMILKPTDRGYRILSNRTENG